MEYRLPLALSLVCLALVLPRPGVADISSEMARSVCEREARNLSGYSGGLLPDLSTGRVSLGVSGSASVGVVRSWGDGPGANAPAHAGEGAREKRRLERKARYQQVYESCMARK